MTSPSFTEEEAEVQGSPQVRAGPAFSPQKGPESPFEAGRQEPTLLLAHCCLPGGPSLGALPAGFITRRKSFHAETEGT